MQASTIAVASKKSAADWLRSPAYDVTLIFGVLALALVLGGAAALHPALFWSVLTFDIWVLAYPHVTSTYTRVAFDRASARRYWFLLAGLPPLVLAGTAGIAALGGAGALFTAYYVGQTYHYTRQSYGIARGYRRRGGASPSLLADAVVYAFPLWGLLHRASQGHEVFYENALFLPRIPAIVANGAGAVTAVLFVFYCVQELRELMDGSRRWGHVAFVLSHVLVTVTSYVIIPEITPGWLIVNIWHNAQYLLFVWAFNATRFKDGPDAESPFLSRLCQPRNLWAYALFCVAFGALLHAALGQLGASLARSAFPIVLVLHLSVNFHHYLVDGVVWKRRATTPALLSITMLACALCRQPLIYVHGHAACSARGCPMFGQNQAECCSGETAETCPVVVVAQGAVPRDEMQASLSRTRT